MSRTTLNIVLLILFAAFLVLNVLEPVDFRRRNFEFFPDMAHSVRRAAFSPNEVFADGKTLQAPEPGTIPKGYHPLDYKATPQDAHRAGEELRNPFSVTDAGTLERGTSVFASFCQPCHGPRGTGDGPVAMRGFPAPPSLLADHAVEMKDGQMFHVLTYGQANMPSYRAQISPEDRWKVILYVRSLQSKRPASAQPSSPAQATPAPARASTGGQR